MISPASYGKHLTLDGYGGNREALADLRLVYRFLEETPQLIGMTKITPPWAFRYDAPVPDDWGITGVVLIAESHISIHTYPEKGYLSMDVFSCKDFDESVPASFARGLFDLTEIEINVIERGKKFKRGKV